MSISNEILQLAERLRTAIDVPDIVGLHLPEINPGDEYRDEFGFVFLADGTAAPFYVSLPGTLPALHARFPNPGQARLSLEQGLSGLALTSLPERALALGAWNAMSQHLLRLAGFEFPPRGSAAGFEPQPGEEIGMVGYFCPVIDRLVEQGNRVLVIEQQPGRVPRRSAVRLSENLAALADCRLVYCTASTLVNGTLEQVLAACRNAQAIDLIGPSGSGLPDILFQHGIHAVGGVAFSDAAALRDCIARRDSWGSVGAKYELTPAEYPGADALLAAVTG